jgi:hypothetical protein
LCRILFELNRLVPNGMPGGVRGGRNFPLLDSEFIHLPRQFKNDFGLDPDRLRQHTKARICIK